MHTSNKTIKHISQTFYPYIPISPIYPYIKWSKNYIKLSKTYTIPGKNNQYRNVLYQKLLCIILGRFVIKDESLDALGIMFANLIRYNPGVFIDHRNTIIPSSIYTYIHNKLYPITLIIELS